MTTKRAYLSLLLQCRPDWIRSSMENPAPRMSKTHIRLHAVALRRMGAKR